MTVARVDLRPGLPSDGSRTAPTTCATHDLALQNIRQTVRSDDRVCPYGLSRIAVAFGSDSGAVAPRTLGERLARAVGQGAGPGAGAQRGPGDDRRSGPGRDAGAPPAGRDRTATIPSFMVVTVDRLVDERPRRRTENLVPLTPPGHGPFPFASTVWAPILRRRTVVRYSTCRLAGYGTRHDDNLPEPVEGDTLGTVLVVDPGPASNTPPGLSAVAASSLAQRLGCSSAVISLTADDNLILDIDGVGVDLVVMVIGGEPAKETSTWSASTWSVPARLVGAYTALGVDVLAVGAGAGAGALAACVEQGATALTDIDGLPAKLHTLLGGQKAPRDELRRLSGRFEALMQLTASERRVLYFLTKGRSAQDIAEDLVVSLATVRSHIRSILRKLGVRSQLAAVAIANSRDLDDIAVIDPS